MFKTPYETTTLSSYNVTNIKNEIEKELVRGDTDFEPMFNGYPYVNSYVKVINDSADYGYVPLFSQPLIINTNPVINKPDDNRLIIDCRGFVSADRDGKLSIKKLPQYKNHLICAGLSTYWYFDGANAMLNMCKFPTKVFASWITGTLASKLNLDELSQVKTSAIVAYYFICMFNDFPEYSESYKLDEDESYSIGLKVAYATGLKTQDAIEMIKDIPTMRNINDLSAALKQHGGSDRYRQINTALIYMLLGRFGMNGMTPETVIASIEFPPLFFAIVYIAATERGYNKSSVGNIVHNLRNLADVKSFTSEISDILQGE